MVKEVQPPYPNLLDCQCQGECCALSGCFFENAIQRISPKRLGFEKAHYTKDTLIEMAFECKCKKAQELAHINIGKD